MKRLFERLGIRYHWQNLNEIGFGRGRTAYGPARHGRAWFCRHEEDLFSCEWALRSGSGPGFSFQLNQSDGREIELRLSLDAAIYLSVPAPSRLTKLLPRYEDREISIRIFDGTVWWTVWRDPMGDWDRSVPRWREGSWNVLDALFGKDKIERETLDTEDVFLPLPEGDYPATIQLEQCWHRRTRLPRWLQRTYVRADVQPTERAVPVPGKGTAAHNCGDGAVYSASFPARSVDEAITKFVADRLRDRLRHGGPRDLRWEREVPRVAAGGGQ